MADHGDIAFAVTDRTTIQGSGEEIGQAVDDPGLGVDGPLPAANGRRRSSEERIGERLEFGGRDEPGGAPVVLPDLGTDLDLETEMVGQDPRRLDRLGLVARHHTTDRGDPRLSEHRLGPSPSLGAERPGGDRNGGIDDDVRMREVAQHGHASERYIDPITGATRGRGASST